VRLDELEGLLRTLDDGRYWLESKPTGLGVELVAYPSVDGAADTSTVLARLPVYREEVGKAPGQTWPLGLNHGIRYVELPLPEDDYEELLGEPLALRVLHVLTLAYRAEFRGKTADGIIWRSPNPDIALAWEHANDRAALLNEKRKMHL
jgi:hypothetical protein